MRERRDELRLSRADVARRMPGKVSENQIYRWELGKHQPNPDTLQALAEVLECDVSYFMVPDAPESGETPDLFPGAGSQLDRIEAQLTQLQEALDLERAAATIRAAEVLRRIGEAEEAIRHLLPSQRRAGRA